MRPHTQQKVLEAQSEFQGVEAGYWQGLQDLVRAIEAGAGTTKTDASKLLEILQHLIRESGKAWKRNLPWFDGQMPYDERMEAFRRLCSEPYFPLLVLTHPLIQPTIRMSDVIAEAEEMLEMESLK